MANTSSVSSEEELLQLRNEGRITDDEYEDLRQTLGKTTKRDTSTVSQDKAVPGRTSGLAIASLVFALVGFIGCIGCIPAVVCGHLALRRIQKDPMLRGHGLALAGLVIGYVVLGLSLALSIPLLLWISLDQAESAQYALELKRFPLDDMEELITKTDVQIDKEISSDGNGSLRIEAPSRMTVYLFETGDIDIEDARLIYQARLRTEDLRGLLCLEMWCHFPGKGEYFSRGLKKPMAGTTNWRTEETPFLLKKGQNPDNVKLNLLIDGPGTVWIDDIRLLKGPLKH